MNIGFFADGLWSIKALEYIHQSLSFNITFICARHECPRSSILTKFATSNNIPIFSFPNVNDISSIEAISKYDSDLFVSLSFDQIFKKQILQIPKLGAINLHATKLPDFKGRYCFSWMLLNDVKESAITVHYIDESIDTGDIILQYPLPISDQDDLASLFSRSVEISSVVIIQALTLIHAKCVLPIPQSSYIHSQPIICNSINDDDLFIDWTCTDRFIFNKVRAFSHPGPLARTRLGDNIVYVHKAELIPNTPSYIGSPGHILHKQGDTLLVKTGQGYIRILDYSTDSIDIKSGLRFS